MPSFYYAKNVTRDAEEHAAGLSAWEQRYEQISAGPFEGSLEDFRIGPVQVFQEQATRAVFQNGRPRPDTFTVALTRAPAGAGWFCGHRLEGQRTIVMPGDAEFELMAEAGMNLLAVCIDTAHLAEAATRRYGADARLGFPCPGVLTRATSNQGPFEELLDCAMLLAREQPRLLQQDAARRMLALSLTEAVLDCATPAQHQGQPPTTASMRRHIVAGARHYMRAHADEAISVDQLCLATGVSRRALQYAFEEVLQVSPVTYLRAMRLNRVRSDLRIRSGESVGDIAARWGFWHLSRFASDYRSLFGELPSATRSRAIVGSFSGAQTARQR